VSREFNRSAKARNARAHDKEINRGGPDHPP